jgi:hypothetical protein
MGTLRHITPFILLLSLGACAEDLGDEPAPDGGPGVSLDMHVAPPSEHVRHTDLGEGVTETLVDGTSVDSWVALDLDAAGAELAVDIESDTDWDLAIQRYHFRTNGGAGGPADVRVAVLEGVTLAEVTQAPSEGWRQDREPTDSEIPDDVPMGEEPPPTTVISGEDDPWYDYDGATHQLSPKDRVYVLESTGAQYFALQIVDYYSPETADAGWPAFQWKAVDPPAPPAVQTATLDAGDAESWLRFSFAEGVVSVAEPATDLGWDLAFRRTQIATHSGTSGDGMGGAADVEVSALEAAEVPDEIAVDEELPLPGPPGSGSYSGNPALATWYDYDPATHQVSPRDTVFVVRAASGAPFALRISGYADAVYELEWLALGGE